MAETIQPVFDRSQYAYSEQVKRANSELGKNEFLKILITQLQNQDPTNPMEDTAMIAQMAQFSALEAMNNMSNSFALSQAYSMIGQGILGFTRDEDTGVVTQVAGTVDSAGLLNGKPYVMVGEEIVYVENVTQVFDNSIISGNAQSILAGINVVGKYVRAEIPEGDKKITIEGLAEKLIMHDGNFFVLVGGREVALFQIVEVSIDPFKTETDGGETIPGDGDETVPVDGGETIPGDGDETIPVDGGGETTPETVPEA